MPETAPCNNFTDVRSTNDNEQRYLIVSDALSIDNSAPNINVNNQTNKYKSDHRAGLHNIKVRDNINHLQRFVCIYVFFGLNKHNPGVDIMLTLLYHV